MKNLLTRDLPPRAATVVVTLALLASVVAGNEEPRPRPSISPEKPSVVTARQEPLDLAPLSRRAREGEIQDIFTTPAPAAAAPPPAPVAAAKPAPAPPPSAPALPFRFLGFLVTEGEAIVYLERGGATLDARAGDTLAPDYRLESISDTEVTFVYLPLGQKQALQIPPP